MIQTKLLVSELEQRLFKDKDRGLLQVTGALAMVQSVMAVTTREQLP